MHHHMHVAESCQPLTAGSIVILSRFPDTKWVLQYGWYSYEGGQYNGWYFCSIPAQNILPATNEELMDLTVVSQGHGPCPPGPPLHPPPPSIRPATKVKPVEIYLSGVSYEKGQLVYLSMGKLYQVVDDYISSTRSDVTLHNMQIDILDGKLVPIDREQLSIAVEFYKTFGTHEPTKEDVDIYLQGLVPPVIPVCGIKFLNIDTKSPTHLATYEYYEQGDELIFIKNEVPAPIVVAKEPIIQDGTWWIYDVTTETYVDSGQAVQGPKGEPGEPGEKGENGLSAYEIWLNAGNTGSEEEFLNSLKAAVKIDPTLSILNAAADAKAVGDAISNVQETSLNIEDTYVLQSIL